MGLLHSSLDTPGCTPLPNTHLLSTFSTLSFTLPALFTQRNEGSACAQRSSRSLRSRRWRSAAIATVERSNLAAVAYLDSGFDIEFHQHERRLELVAGPQCPVIQVAAWLTLFDKFACIKNPVVGLEPEMTVRLPVQFRARTVSNKTCIAVSCRNNQKSGDGVDSILQALSPLKDPVDGDSHTPRQRRFSARVYVNKVEGAGACRGENAKIITLWEKRIECSEGVRPWIVAARDIRLSAESRFQGDCGDAIASFRRGGPGFDVSRAERAELPKRFIVEIPPGFFGGNSARKSRA